MMSVFSNPCRAAVLALLSALFASTVGHATTVPSTASIYLVVSAISPLKTVTQKEVIALYTGRSRSLNGSDSATPLDQRRDSDARAEFYQTLTGKDIASINSYWARLHFTGQVQPPQTVADDAAMVQRLRADPSAIGYLTRDPQDASLRVVLRLP